MCDKLLTPDVILHSRLMAIFLQYFYFSLEEEGVKRSGEGMGEIILLKNEIEVSNSIIALIYSNSVAFYLHLSLPPTLPQNSPRISKFRRFQQKKRNVSPASNSWRTSACPWRLSAMT